MDDVAFVQRRWGVLMKFSCRADGVTYYVRDSSGSAERAIPYDKLDPSSMSLVAPRANQPIILANLVWAMSLGCGFAEAIIHDNGAWLLISVPFFLFMLAGRFTRMLELPMSVLPAAGGSGTMRILRGRQHDLILDTLTARWRAAVRSKMMMLNLNGDLSAEQRKFDWLLSNGFITEAEHALASSKIITAGQTLPITDTLN